MSVTLGWEDVMKAAPLRNLGYCQETVLLSGQYYQKLLQWRLACHAKVDRCLDEQLYRDDGSRRHAYGTEVAMLKLTMPPKQSSSDELCPKIRHVEGSQ